MFRDGNRHHLQLFSDALKALHTCIITMYTVDAVHKISTFKSTCHFQDSSHTQAELEQLVSEDLMPLMRSLKNDFSINHHSFSTL